MNSKNSGLMPLRTTADKLIGRLHSGSGLAMPIATTSELATVDHAQLHRELSPSLKEIVSVSALCLVVTLNRMPKTYRLPADYPFGRALSDLTIMHGRLSDLAAKATPEQVAAVLAGLADLFQVELPTKVGLKLYVSVVSELPHSLLVTAARRVAQSHRFKTLPNPAELLEAVNREHEELAAWVKHFAYAIARLHDHK